MAVSNASKVTEVVARLERLPLSPWHVKVRIVVGIATFFDAFDALTIAYILPVLVPLWGLKPDQISLLISIGYVGQLVGAIFFGWLAEKIGRLRVTVLTISVFAIMSLLCAVAWSYTSLFVLRLIQGIGLGGEVPVAASYINELARAKGRGKFVLLYELIFPVGLVAAALAGYWVVPHLGWRWMFILGAIPAVLINYLRRRYPESPRWLAAAGHTDRAEEAMRQIEEAVRQSARLSELPPPAPVAAEATGEARTRWTELFAARYWKRTLVVWSIWFVAYLANYGLTSWLPTIYKTVFKLGLQQSLLYPLITQIVGLAGTFVCAMLIDRMGRRAWIGMAFIVSAAFLFILWNTGIPSAQHLLLYNSLSYFFISSICLGVYLYTPELYPTRMRALGSSVASAWLRLASIIGPMIVGRVVAGGALPRVFLLLAICGVVAGLITWLFGTETKGEVLERISP